MENISKSELSFRLDKIKNKASEINSKIIKNNEEIDNRYNFASKLGIKSNNTDTNDEIMKGLNSYIEKADEILSRIDNVDYYEKENEYKILNNMLYLDDIKLNNIEELVQEDKRLSTREYINKIADRANDLIRDEEIKDIDVNIALLSRKSSFIDKLTGKDKIKKALLENYNLKRVEAINKKYVPHNKSILEIVNITKNCGYKSDIIDSFIIKLVNEYNLGELNNNALIPVDKKVKIPFFYNRELISKLNSENSNMLDKINNKKKEIKSTSEYKMYKDMLKKDVSTLELFNFNNIIDEVI